MGRKNLCVTSQHNTNSVNVQSNHIPINNGDRTKTVLPMTTNSSQKTKSIKTHVQVTCIIFFSLRRSWFIFSYTFLQFKKIIISLIMVFYVFTHRKKMFQIRTKLIRNVSTHQILIHLRLWRKTETLVCQKGTR